MRRIISSDHVHDLEKREQTALNVLKHTAAEGSCETLIQTVVHRIMESILGGDAALAKMRAYSLGTSPSERTHSNVDAGQLQSFIFSILKTMRFPNSVLVNALIYIDRAISPPNKKLQLTDLNWQPIILTVIIISSKLHFDNPVYNEDFARSLCISNVNVALISTWEADFLRLLSFNVHISVNEYVQQCFTLQSLYQRLHGRSCKFFTYLMSDAGACSVAGEDLENTSMNQIGAPGTLRHASSRDQRRTKEGQRVSRPASCRDAYAVI